MSIQLGQVRVVINGYPASYPLPMPRHAPRTPAYFPRMKVRGRKRRQKWAWVRTEITSGVREALASHRQEASS